MSSSYLKGTSGSGPVPPEVATQYDTNVNTPAIPAANILEVIGGNTEQDSIFGIQTDGSSGGNTLTVQLTNRLPATTFTVGAETKNIIVFPTTPPLADGTYLLDYKIVANNSSDVGSGASFEIQGTITVNAGTITLNGTPTRTMIGDETVFNVSLVDIQPGVGILNLQIDGVAGKNMFWGAVLTYLYSG